MAAEGSEQAEVFHLQRLESPIHFEANQLKSIETREMAGAALRLIKDGRVGFGSTTNLSTPEKLIGVALETAPFGVEAKFEFPGPAAYPDVPVYDPAVEQSRLDEMVSLGQSVIDTVRSYSDEVQVGGSVSRSVSTISLLNSRGARSVYTKSTYSLGFEGTVIRGEDMLFVFDFMSSCHPITDATSVAENMIRQLRLADVTAPMTTGVMPVIFTPTAVSSILLSPLVSGLNGKTVLLGTSPLVDKRGERIVDARFGLTDDPTIPFIPGSRPSDDEGVASRRMPLIDQGVAANFMYDLQTGAQSGVVSTGNGERGLGSLPGPSTSVLTVAEGDAEWEDLLAEIKDGLVIERLLGAGQSNILGGDFNANVLLGYKVENGCIVGRVKDTMVSGNVYRALNNLIGIGNTGRWLGGGLFTPAIACADVEVTSK